ncbi:SDR family oxidoreductase [Azonexus caeni]|jgi:NAD(P)-dependent dehydrogenase (short-subunit alcohol dehydrogenase family)|uniref:SDR family oxidoreductase n=1 Tax=Azonexus caeni TaxID=266126 RepID=UPI003A8424CA
MQAILTGHSRGLGAALAAELLGRGIPLLGLARQGNPALAAAYPGRLSEAALDLADDAALRAWLDSQQLGDFLAADDGPLLLINNAGVLGPMAALDAQAPGEIAAAIAINVSAPLLFSAALARRHAGELRILHISSGAARHPYPGWSIYGASKAALDHHARCVAADGRAKLRICALAPGVIDTDMQTRIRASAEADFPLKDKFVALKAEGRLSTPQGAARAVVDYLLSEKFGSQPVADLRELG